MVDVMKWARLALIAFVLFVFGTAFMQPGIAGKLFVVILVALLMYMFKDMIVPKAKPKALDTYEDRLKIACRLKGAVGLKMVKMTGDASNGWYYKGKVIGGPTIEMQKDLPADHPKKFKLVFLYTPDLGWKYTFPIISTIMAPFRRQQLLAIFHNPGSKVSQLVPSHRLASLDKRDRHYQFYGDLEVRGITTVLHRNVEYVNDEFYDPKFEDAVLEEHVKRITLHEFLNDFSELQDSAIRGDAIHQKRLQFRDYFAGDAKPGEAS